MIVLKMYRLLCDDETFIFNILKIFLIHSFTEDQLRETVEICKVLYDEEQMRDLFFFLVDGTFWTSFVLHHEAEACRRVVEMFLFCKMVLI